MDGMFTRSIVNAEIECRMAGYNHRVGVLLHIFFSGILQKGRNSIKKKHKGKAKASLKLEKIL